MFHDSHVFCLQNSNCSWLYCLWYASEILLIVPRISHYRWLSPNFGWFSSIYMWYMVGSQLSQLVVGQDVNMLYTLLVVSDIADSGSHGRKRWLDDGIDRKNHSVILQYWNPVKLPKGILLNLIIVVLLLYYCCIMPRSSHALYQQSHVCMFRSWPREELLLATPLERPGVKRQGVSLGHVLKPDIKWSLPVKRL
jgi:hypothetical protein